MPIFAHGIIFFLYLYVIYKYMVPTFRVSRPTTCYFDMTREPKIYHTDMKTYNYAKEEKNPQLSSYATRCHVVLPRERTRAKQLRIG